MTTATPIQTAPSTTGFPFDNSYARLPEGFFAVRPPTPVPEPRLIRFNHGLAAELGLDTAGLDEATLAEIFAGNRLPEGALPIAMAYAGHQFGQFVPQLGDGRAILLGEVVGRDGRRRDIQLKGAGRTPYSRGGDGRAPLGPVLREYLVSEAMHALGIPTTRALAAVTTGEPVMRQTIQPGAVITRVAASHVRIGTFQFFAARGWTTPRSNSPTTSSPATTPRSPVRNGRISGCSRPSGTGRRRSSPAGSWSASSTA
jgi:serine/tyrosine/threonine adenylyltransferase